MRTEKGVVQRMRVRHTLANPNCTYGDRAHYVPPCFGDLGFYLCNPPSDIRNHVRCLPPFDHDHEDHVITPPDPLAGEER